MKLIELTSSDKELYNRFVAESQGGSFLQAWEWGEWQAALGREVKRFEWRVESGEVAAVTQLIKMPLPLGKYYLYAPYGPVIGSRKSEVGSSIIEALQNKFPDAVFIRIESKSELPTTHYPLPTKSPNIQPGKTLLIDLRTSADELLAEMHPKTRYNIKVAQKHGVEIKDEFAISVGHGLFFDEALKLIIATSKRQKFATFPESYYKKMVDFFALGNNGAIKLHIYKAIFQNQLLAAAIMVDCGQTRTFLFGGSSEFHKNVMAPYLLHWQAIQDAKTAGLNFYDFWGTETASGAVPGFVRFKLGFGGQEHEYGGAYDVVNKKWWYKAYKALRQANRAWIFIKTLPEKF